MSLIACARFSCSSCSSVKARLKCTKCPLLLLLYPWSAHSNEWRYHGMRMVGPDTLIAWAPGMILLGLSAHDGIATAWPNQTLLERRPLLAILLRCLSWCSPNQHLKNLH